MTPAQLTLALASVLSDLLGYYALTKGATSGPPAIHHGDPPSDWDAYGLEVIVDPYPDQAPITLQGGEHNIREAIEVRLVTHGTGDPTNAVRRILRRYSDASVTRVPANPRLGILDTRTVTIPT